MKKSINHLKPLVIILVYFIFSPKIKAQEAIQGFHIIGQEIIWQKIINTTYNKNEITDFFKFSGLFKDLKIEGNKLYGELVPFDPFVPAKRTHLAVMDGFMEGFVLIELKEGRYRVTFKRIIYIDNEEEGKVIKKEINEIFLRKHKGNLSFKGGFKNGIAQILDDYFSQMFLVTTSPFKDDNW